MAVEEYCTTLREICGFKYVSRAVILHPQRESVRYYLVFATNSPHGIEVFKSAESQATEVQDDVRFKAHLKKSAPTLLGLFDEVAPKSRLSLKLTEKYRDLAARRIVTLLLDNSTSAGVEYERLFGEAMSFPLVTSEDLARWLKTMKPFIQIDFAKSPKRPKPKKPSPFENDRVIVIDRRGLSCWSREANRS